MLKEYLLRQGSGTGRWGHGMPGVQICRFSLPEPEQEPAGLNPAMLLVVLAVLGGIGALVYFKFIKQKPKTKGSDNLDDYDYGEDEEDEDCEFEDENTADSEEDKNQ